MVKEWGGVGMFESDHRYNRCINVFNYNYLYIHLTDLEFDHLNAYSYI